MPDRVVKVDVVQNVVEVERERQVVTARRTATTTETATAKTATAAATRTTHATAAHNCARATFIARPLTLVLLTGVSTAAFRTKRPRLADTQVYGRRARALAEVARNHYVARCQREFEVAKRRTSEIGPVVTVDSGRRQHRPFPNECVTEIGRASWEGKKGAH